MLEPLFNKVSGLHACNFIKNRLKHRCFPVNTTKSFRAAFFIEHLRWLLLKRLAWKPSLTHFQSMFPLLGLDKLTFTHPIFRAPKKAGAQNQSNCASLIEKQMETFIFALCYLNRISSFHFHCSPIKCFCNETFAMSILFECLK